jgi:hypothetical protein
LTQSPELGFGFRLSSSWNGFVFTRLWPLSLGCCCATVRTLLRSAEFDPDLEKWQEAKRDADELRLCSGATEVYGVVLTVFTVAVSDGVP